MVKTPLNTDEKKILLELARRTIEQAVNHAPIPALDLKNYSENLRTDGASFVTITKSGGLRGCIGALEAYQPLVQDVCEHAAAASLEDYRFPPVKPDEVIHLCIEISRLTPPQPLDYSNASDLLSALRPGVDGLILRDGRQRATFLPQVWEKIPDKADFLSQLCMKMGAAHDTWRHKPLQAAVYQVEEFSEQHK